MSWQSLIGHGMSSCNLLCFWDNLWLVMRCLLAIFYASGSAISTNLTVSVPSAIWFVRFCMSSLICHRPCLRLNLSSHKPKSKRELKCTFDVEMRILDFLLRPCGQNMRGFVKWARVGMAEHAFIQSFRWQHSSLWASWSSCCSTCPWDVKRFLYVFKLIG